MVINESAENLIFEDNAAPVKTHTRPSCCSPFVIVVSALILALAIAVPFIVIWAVRISAQPSFYPDITFPVSSSPLGVFQSAAVACDNGYCSTIGKNMLKQGGSAVDAAIAAMLCNGVVNMHNLGIGGGFFAIVWDSKNGSAFAFDAYGTSPANFSNDMYIDHPKHLEYGKLSVLIPGEIAGYHEMHSQFGKLPWSDLFAPAIELCRAGFLVGTALAEGIHHVKTTQNVAEYPEMKNLVTFLTNPNTNTWYNEGDVMKCPELASTLEAIAKNGPSDFYNGSVSDLVLADLNELEVPISKEDISLYKVNTSREPLEMHLRNGLSLLTVRPPSSGAAAAFTLNILSDYNWTVHSGKEPLTYHRYLEALKFAWGQWSYFGDEAFLDATELEARLQNISSPDMGRYVRQKINDNYVLQLEEYGTYGTPPLFDDTHHSTSHISVLDANGNAVSLTSTVNGNFGSFVLGKRTGIIFNNGMSNFNIKTIANQTFPLPPYNFISPGKRPMSAISPMMFVNRDADFDKAVTLIVGASGGSRIVCTVPYVALRTLFFDETIKQAVDAYRFQHNLIPDILYYEPAWPAWVLSYLNDKGHVTQKPFSTSRSSISQAIQRLSNGSILAISDFRKGGEYTDGY